MKHIELHSAVVLRTPAFSYSEGLETNWEALKDAISHSSPEFYNLIREMTYEQLQKANSKIRMSVHKYYNRAAFRSTPYGKFASVSSAFISPGAQQSILVSERQTIHSFADWSQRPKDTQHLETIKQSEALLFSNTTFYLLQDEIRFVQNAGDKLILSAVGYDNVLFEILDFCSVPKKYNQLSAAFPLLNPDVLDGYVEAMIELSLIITSLDINIIGEDYFKRTGRYIERMGKQYLITERKVINGSLDKRLFRHLPELAAKLLSISAQNKMQDLEEFKANFIKRFEQAEVPIMIALDPDAGIGYGELHTSVDQPRFTKVFAAASAVKVAEPQQQDLRNMLYREILSKSGKIDAINLEDILAEKTETPVLPNSFSAVCSSVDGEIFLEMMGGATATALPGRFALGIPAIYQHCREIAQLEQDANPSVLFFDIGYTKEDHVDNINRRPCIYDIQLSILNFDTTTSALPIHDILVSIQKDEVVLRSRRYDKRIVPRFASAYNHVRSDLPLYRLLMDIQSQGLTTNLTLKPMSLIPGLPYYPRVQFKNIVVSPACWQLSKKIVEGISDMKTRSIVLQDYLKSKLSCSYIKTGKGDQTLCLCVDSITDIELLLSSLEKENVLYVEEAYIPLSACVKDTNGKPFLPQIILTLLHNDAIISPLRHSLSTTPSTNKKEWIGPGNLWLYFELYCNPFQADILLQRRITNFLKVNKKKISSWFFIRYNENGHHLRLRLHMTDIGYGYQLMGDLTKLINEDLQAGVISEVKVKTYKREVHRYSAYLMDKVEKHFFKDSKLVLAILPGMISDMKKYKLCADVLDGIASSGALAQHSFDLTIRNVVDSFNKEHNMTHAGFKELNKMYGDFLKESLPQLDRKTQACFNSFKNSLICLLWDCDVFNRPALMTDLMHMHVNRFFASNQRKHEAVLYNFYTLLSKRKVMHINESLDRRA
jgi:thiopeptide-type bacteriocin biosynthesis protein